MRRAHNSGSIWGLVVCAAAAACSGEGGGLSGSVSELGDGLQDAAQGCSWRATRAVGYDPREPASCYDVFTGPNARLADFELADVCDAPELPSPLLVRPGETAGLWGYYDRNEMPAFKILRYQRLDDCP